MKTTMTRSRNAGLAAVAIVLLAGCSATHVGESWQCPLAQGTSCTTIAEADPAVPAAAARPAVLFGEPLHGARPLASRTAAGGRRDRGGACDRDCGPLAWLTGLFRGSAGNDPAALPPEAPAAAAAAEPAAAGSAITADDSLRVPEVLGRIWIAPFVDQDGIYREAHWVRVVLEPAGWKLP
ncbi:MAG: TraV family lipoprotein [Rhodospirillales bacterium]|nr:TraV family lipoprotein [Rhodospirillales bacterium]